MRAKFNKRHYEFLAGFLAREIAISAEEPNGAVRENVLYGITRLLATELAHDNPKFDRDRFMRKIDASVLCRREQVAKYEMEVTR